MELVSRGAARLRPRSDLVIIHVDGRSARARETRFAALDVGDVEPFRELLAPAAQWVAIPQGEVYDTPNCANRVVIIDRLKRLLSRGRRFQLGKVIEAGDRVAVESPCTRQNGLRR